MPCSQRLTPDGGRVSVAPRPLHSVMFVVAAWLVIGPAAAFAGPSVTSRAPLPGVSSASLGWELPLLEPVISTRERAYDRPRGLNPAFPWLRAKDLDYRDDRSGWWNQRYRAGRGVLSVDASARQYQMVSPDDHTYVHNARAFVGKAYLRASGVLYPGVELSLEGGASHLQVRPAGDDGFDRYAIGYHFGAGFSAALSLGRAGLFAIEGRFYSYENRSDRDSNDAVTLNLGDPVVYRTYHFVIGAHLYLELVGGPSGPLLGLKVGGGYEFLDGHFQTLTREDVRLSARQELFAHGGLIFASSQQWAVTTEVTLAERNGYGARLSIGYCFE